MPIKIDIERVDWTQLPLTHQATVPQEYLDEMGHMNVMYYVHKFDQGTWQLFSHIGLTKTFLETNQRALAAVEQNLKYKNFAVHRFSLDFLLQ